MTKYTWNIEIIKDRLKKLMKALEIEKDPKRKRELQYDIESLNVYLDEYYDQKTEGQIKVLDGYRMTRSCLEPDKFVWGDFKEFQKETEQPLIYIPPLKRNSLTKEDILDITHDFFKSQNNFFFGHFMKNFYRRNNHIAFRNENPSNEKGNAVLLLTSDEAFINVFRYFNIDDLFTTIHEYMHTTSNCINHHHVCPPKNLFMEIDSIFAELIASDYLEGIFKNGQPTLVRALEHGRYTCTADELIAKIQLIEYEQTHRQKYKNNKDIKTVAKEHFELEPEEIDRIFTKPYFQDSTYLMSYIFALELYKLYLLDKDKALYVLKKLILLECKSSEQYYQKIKELGLIPNAHVRELHRQFTNEAMNLTRKKPKN